MSLIPDGAMRILDIGCGAGMTADLIRDRCPNAFVVGVELDEELVRHASQRMDDLVQGGIESIDVQERLWRLAPFDLIICADVLEHLVEPSAVLSILASMVKPGGHVITSLPNVRHLSTFFSLGVMGTWPARSRGIHDRTHLRFYARKDILRLAQGSGMRLLREKRNVRILEAHAWSMVPARVLDFWPFRPFLTFQYLHLWKVGHAAGT